MKKTELKKNARCWCWWKSRYLFFTGYEGAERGYNQDTKDYTPRHYYRFEDAAGAEIRIYDAQLAQLRKEK